MKSVNHPSPPHLLIHSIFLPAAKTPNGPSIYPPTIICELFGCGCWKPSHLPYWKAVSVPYQSLGCSMQSDQPKHLLRYSLGVQSLRVTNSQLPIQHTFVLIRSFQVPPGLISSFLLPDTQPPEWIIWEKQGQHCIFWSLQQHHWGA